MTNKTSLDSEPSASTPPSVKDELPCVTVDTHVSLTSRGMIRLYGVWSVAFLATFMAGYGVASMTAINAIPTYQAYFDFDGLGISTGLVFSMWPIAAVVTFWLGPILSDRLGRRGGMFICSLLYILGTCLIAFSQNLAMLLCGRFLLGASVGMIQPAAPPYIAELAPPEGRGSLTGLFNVCWIIGGVAATGVSIGTSSMSSNWAWRIPMTLQLIPPVIMASTILFLPESPRWLYANGRPEEARRILARYHGDGHSTPLVELELHQIKTSIESATKKWAYRDMVKTRASRHRLLLAVMMGAFGQLTGNGLTYYLPAIYKQVGVDSVRKQLVMTLIATLVTLVGALLGTYQNDRLGRRKVLIFGTLMCSVLLACAMGSSAASNVKIDIDSAQTDTSSINRPASKAAIAFLILFGGAFGWGYLPLAPIYPSEVLSMEMRSSGLGVMVLSLNLASFLNQFAIPIALKRIGYWTFLPFVCWDLIEAAAWYLLAVETRNRTLEEIDDIFNSPNPVKTSLKIQQVRQIRGQQPDEELASTTHVLAETASRPV